MACREAVALARDLNSPCVRIASDCLNVITSIQQGTMGTYAHIVRELKEVVSEFAEMVFVHEGRNSNKEAHSLARSCLGNDPGRLVWLITPPVGVCISVRVEFE